MARSRRRSSRRTPESELKAIMVTFGVIAALSLIGTVTAALKANPWLLPLLIAGGVVIVVGGTVLLFLAIKARRTAAQRQQLARLGFLTELGGLHSLSPTDFERLVRDLMVYWGYQDVRHTGGSGDLGADITARTSGGQAIIAQCKQYRLPNKVKSGEMQQFIGMLHVHHRTNLGLYVTTSEFTRDARDLGVQHGIRLIDGQELVGHIRQWRASLVTVAPRA